MERIIEKYKELCETPSDINEHLQTLMLFGGRCKHITEMGVRRPTSTYAFLASRPTKLICYDIGRYPEVDIVENLCAELEIDFKFNLEDVLKVEIEETDLLFIDTFHSGLQLSRELDLHSKKVRKYLIFHDTTTFWERAESTYDIAAKNRTNGIEGLKYAIEPFLKNNPQWKVIERFEFNNGLMILGK